MDYLLHLYSVIDLAFMPFYRFPESALAGYALGTVMLAAASVIAGECSIAWAYRLNRKMIKRDSEKMTRYEGLSIAALKAGDKAAFKACNGIANETYGKSFFTQITLAAASLWPLFIALGWMQYRFSGVEFRVLVSLPLTGGVFGYLSTFLVCYIMVRLIFSRIKKIMNSGYSRSSLSSPLT